MIAAEVEVYIKENAADELMKGFMQGMAVAANDLKERILERLSISNQRGQFPALPGESPHRGNGDLMRSIQARRIGPFQWHVGSFGTIYGLLQEIGGFIGVRNKQWLTIPTSKQAAAHRTRKGTALEFPAKLRFVPVPGRIDIAFLVDAANQTVIHYLLKKRVYIPAHPYLRPAAADPEWHNRAMHFMGDAATGLGAVSTIASTVA